MKRTYPRDISEVKSAEFGNGLSVYDGGERLKHSKVWP